MLSVVTVACQNLEGLRMTVRNVFEEQGGFRDLEMIVVDGGSSDGTKEWLEAHSAMFAWWCSEKDGGIFFGQNKGTDHARGRYLLFLNSGDTLCQGVLPNVFAEPPTEDILYGDQIRVHKDGKETLRTYPDEKSLRPDYFLLQSLPHQGAFFSERVFRDGRRYDTALRFAADAKLFFEEICLRGASIRKLPFPVCRFDASGVGSRLQSLPARIREMRSYLEPHFGPQLMNVVGDGILARATIGAPRLSVLASHVQRRTGLESAVGPLLDLLFAQWRIPVLRPWLRCKARLAQTLARMRNRKPKRKKAT